MDFVISPKHLPLPTLLTKMQTMMRTVLCRITCLALVSSALNAQPVKAQTKTTDKDKGQVTATKKDDRPSPPIQAVEKVGDISITINYSSPGVKGRPVWGELVPYDKVWRTGANEASTIEVSRDCKVGGGMLRAGKYAIFSIPGQNEWTIILNSVPDQWGAYKYDEAKDVLRFKVKPLASPEFNERLKFEIVSDAQANGKIIIYWENLMIPFEIR